MNIWGKLFLIVFTLWLFTEYLRYVKYRLIEIAKEYKILKKAQEELEISAITILKKAYEKQISEELEERRYADAELGGTNICGDDWSKMKLFLKHRQIAKDLQEKYINKNERLH